MSPVDDVEVVRCRSCALSRSSTVLVADRQLGGDLVQAVSFTTTQRRQERLRLREVLSVAPAGPRAGG